MSEFARKHYFPAIADRIASAAARLGSRKLWRSCNRAGLRLIAGWTPTKRSVQVRNLVTLLGLIIALVTALSIPVGYGIIGYLKEASALTYKAELSAARAAQYIYAPDAPWKYDTDQLAAMSEIRTITTAPIVQRILDPQRRAEQGGDALVGLGTAVGAGKHLLDDLAKFRIVRLARRGVRVSRAQIFQLLAIHL